MTQSTRARVEYFRLGKSRDFENAWFHTGGDLRFRWGLGVFDRSWLVSGRDPAACRRWRVVCLVGLPGRVGVLIINLTCLFLRKFFMRFALPITLFGNDHVDLDAMDDKGDIAQILMSIVLILSLLALLCFAFNPALMTIGLLGTAGFLAYTIWAKFSLKIGDEKMAQPGVRVRVRKN